MRGLVRVVFDGEERRLATGLTVRHLLSSEQIHRVLRRELRVVDGRGQQRGLDGALTDGVVLALQERPTP